MQHIAVKYNWSACSVWRHEHSHARVQLSSSLRSLQSITPLHTDDFGKQTLLEHMRWHLPPENNHISWNPRNKNQNTHTRVTTLLTTAPLFTAVFTGALAHTLAALRLTLAVPTQHLTWPAGCYMFFTHMCKHAHRNTQTHTNLSVAQQTCVSD